MVFELYFGFFLPFSGIEWYFKLPLRVPLSPAEISLNGSMVLNDTEWYSMVISGIPLALFCKGQELLECVGESRDLLESFGESRDLLESFGEHLDLLERRRKMCSTTHHL